MAKSNQHDQDRILPTNSFPIISIVTGIFGWMAGIFILLTSFKPLSENFHVGRFASGFLLSVPGLSWLMGMITGLIGLRQGKGKSPQHGTGLAKWGIGVSGIGCALLYGFFLLIALGFYILISKGYIGFIFRSGTVSF